MNLPGQSERHSALDMVHAPKDEKVALDGYLPLVDNSAVMKSLDRDPFLTAVHDVAEYFDVPHAVRGILRAGAAYHRGGPVAALAAIKAQKDNERIPVIMHSIRAARPGFLTAIV